VSLGILFIPAKLLWLTLGTLAEVELSKAAKSPKPAKRSLLGAILAALLLRIAVPVGYMPTALDDGWYLQFCPDGMPVQVMVALFGPSHQHHHQHQGGHHADNPTAAAPSYSQCDLGGALGAEAVDVSVLLVTSPLLSHASRFKLSDETVVAATIHAYQSRAPPLHRLI